MELNLLRVLGVLLGDFEMASSRKSLFGNNSRRFDENVPLEEDSIERKIETLSVSKRLVRSFSQKFKKKKMKSNKLGAYLIAERKTERSSSSNCLSLYIKGVGCNRVGSCEEIDVNGMRKLSISEDCLPLKGIEKKNLRKMKGLEQCPLSCLPEISLPDDILEMILVRVPLRALIVSRLVCKKWNQMIISTQFVQLRYEVCRKNPWVFLFGLTRKGGYVGEVFALDVVEDHWHTIRNDLLVNRFLYSVASIGMDIYVVGGCSDFETHKAVCVFSPLTNLWREVSPMKTARSEPVLGVFEVSANCTIFQNQDNRHGQNRLKLKSRTCGVSDVYEDPHRFSLRRQLRDAINEGSTSAESGREPLKLVGKQGSNQKFTLIVVGGSGSRDEPLDSGEIYDPSTNTWIEIARLPEDFGSVSSGAVCNGTFYIYSSMSNQLASYDLERGFWVLIQTSHPPPCIRVYYPKLVSCRNRLFMCCVCWSERDGQVNNNGEKAVRKLWELDTEIHCWTEVSRHPDAPMDKNAIFVADHERIYGLEMFKVFGQTLDFLTACDFSDTGIEWSRVSRKHAGHEACTYSCIAKSMVALHM